MGQEICQNNLVREGADECRQLFPLLEKALNLVSFPQFLLGLEKLLEGGNLTPAWGRIEDDSLKRLHHSPCSEVLPNAKMVSLVAMSSSMILSCSSRKKIRKSRPAF